MLHSHLSQAANFKKRALALTKPEEERRKTDRRLADNDEAQPGDSGKNALKNF